MDARWRWVKRLGKTRHAKREGWRCTLNDKDVRGRQRREAECEGFVSQ